MQTIWGFVNRLLLSTMFFFARPVYAQTLNPTEKALQIDPETLGFEIPSLGEILTFLVKFFFVAAGLAALFYMLWGALSWVTSGGDKEAVGAARDKIVAAIVGVLVIIAVLAVIWTLEQLVFAGRVCFGVSCPVTIPGLLTPAGPTR